jgi:Caudovirus prohead serine protease
MGEETKPDFSGYATKAGLKCSDGRTIMPDAFKHQDKTTVPLVWQHNHNEPANVLGHAILEHREDGVYAYGYFNDSEPAKNAKTLVQHGDIKSLSIYANGLTEKAKQVIHGFIRELSLVLSGANPGALIDNITLAHADGDLVTLDDEAIIYTGLDLTRQPETESKDAAHADGGGDGPTVQEVYDSMTPQQKEVVHYMVGAALEDAAVGHSAGNKETEIAHSDDKSGESTDDKEKDGRRMTRNVFEQQGGAKEEKHVLTHDAIKGIVADAQRIGSLKEAVEAYALKHGIDNIEILFPDAKNVTDTPEFDSRRVEWVSGVINGTKHSPFSRIKSLVADITFDEARAKGYIKGNLKKEEFFGVSKRVTTPSTIYKKQKLDRDDIIDITDFDVVAWLKGEMRLMMDEELARAILIGDGRDVADEDKIRDPAGAPEGAGIRSILNDHDLYVATVNVNIADPNSSPTEIVDAIITGTQYYKGSGSPTFYTTLPMLTQMLLARDQFGHRLWRTPSELASEMGVSSIVTVEVMENETDLVGIIVNLKDYTVGADRGGEINFFDDFDIDYNQYKYLLETRVSGALTKIRSALVIKSVAGGATLVTPTAPAYDDTTYTVTVPTVAGVTYKDDDTGNTLTTGSPVVLTPGQTLHVKAEPASANSYFADNQHDEWTYSRPAS